MEEKVNEMDNFNTILNTMSGKNHFSVNTGDQTACSAQSHLDLLSLHQQ